MERRRQWRMYQLRLLREVACEVDLVERGDYFQATFCVSSILCSISNLHTFRATQLPAAKAALTATTTENNGVWFR